MRFEAWAAGSHKLMESYGVHNRPLSQSFRHHLLLNKAGVNRATLSCSLHHDAVRIKETKQQLKDKKKDLQKSEETLKKAVARLNISNREKADLETRINELTAKRMRK
jgi:septal ring factor EnvC (AmiA/AmiB activator)